MKIKKVNFNNLDLWVLEETDLGLFRTVQPADKEDFLKWARLNFDGKKELKTIYHPIVQNEMITLGFEKLTEPFAVLDALRGSISGNYQQDLVFLNQNGKTCDFTVYADAYQMDQQP